MRATVRQAIVGILVLVIAAAVAYGVWLAGAPSAVRDQQFDVRRVNDLQQIDAAIEQSYAQQRALPQSIAEVAQTPGVYLTSVTDPQSKQPYEYRVTGETTYELCADFATDSSSTPSGVVPAPMPTKPFVPSVWDHPAGRSCFSRDAKQPSVGETCDAYKACGDKQVCAKLPGKAEAVCVVAGQECAAAGCAKDRCQVLESYPEQVVCAGAAIPAPAACTLMKDAKTGRVDCFGDAAPAGYAPYAPTGVGIPYSCYADATGCHLAQ